MHRNPPSPERSAENSSTHALRHLPTYEEVNIPYSLRLPTYRSSYIRRFHPYARYTTPSAEGFDSDNSDYYYDEDTLLDLTILDEYAPQQPEVPSTSANEIHAINQAGEVEDQDLSETEASLTDPDVHVELEGPRGAFLRIDTITPLHSTDS